MEKTELEQLYSDQWTLSVTACCDALEPDDLRQVSFFNSWEDVQTQVLGGPSHTVSQAAYQEFAMLARGLNHLKTYTDCFSTQIVPKLDTSVFWGLVRLVIKLAQDDKDAIAHIPRMLRELCHKVEILNSYCDKDASSLLPYTKEACGEVALALLTFLSNAVAFIRNDGQYSMLGAMSENQWQPLEQQLSSLTKEIDDSVSRIEKISQRSDKLHEVLQLQSLLSLSQKSARPHADEQAKLPCIILPPTRTSRFFNRTDVITKVEDHFATVDSTRSFRSLALYGLGGVGKSTIALKYAEAKLRKGELDAMFWVHSQKLVNIQQSFTDIAIRLKLPDAQPKDHEENRALVLNWLQNTKCRWLIVYDNAETMDLILAYWPAANRGQAIITTRNHSFAFEPAASGLEITSWDADTGSQFLLHLLSTDIGAQLTTNEAKSAYELSQKLSGHALAISHMAGLIHRRAWSIAEFVEIYNKQPRKIHGISGNSSINALWDIAFKSLDQESHAVLGVLSFVAPDSVPQSLFEPESPASLPESLAFCADHLRFSEVIEDLLTLALIKRDKDSRTYSVHRLVQTSFKYFMNREQRQQNFDNAAILTSLAFPRKSAASAQLYLMWKRYLLEINAYTELEDLINVNTIALETLPREQQSIPLQRTLTSHRGQLLVRLGEPEEGLKWLKKSYDFAYTDVPVNHQERAWCAENAANGIATTNDFPEAIKWQEKARDHWFHWSEKNDPDPKAWPAILKKSMGTTLIWAGERERARYIVTEALRQIETTEPYNWAMAAYTHFALGTLDRHNRELDSAEGHFIEAQILWMKGDQLRTDPFNAACMYRMGCVALDRGKLEAAIKHLRDAIVVTGMRSDRMIAEHARCLFKLSEALQQEPRDEIEASQLREEAEHLLIRRAPNARNPGLEETYDNLVNILWR